MDYTYNNISDLYGEIDNYLSQQYIPAAVIDDAVGMQAAASIMDEPMRALRGMFFKKRSSRSFCKKLEAERPSVAASDYMVAETALSSQLDLDAAVVDRLEESFGTLLLKTISKKGLVNADVYKDANIDRRLFSKIVSNDGYAPAKNTVLALAIGLKLNLDETTSLLKSAGYALSHSSKSDIIVEFFISKTDGHYNIDVVNDALQHYSLPQLGSR